MPLFKSILNTILSGFRCHIRVSGCLPTEEITHYHFKLLYVPHDKEQIKDVGFPHQQSLLLVTFLITETKCVKEEEFVLDHSSEKYSLWWLEGVVTGTVQWSLVSWQTGKHTGSQLYLSPPSVEETASLPGNASLTGLKVCFINILLPLNPIKVLTKINCPPPSSWSLLIA